MNRRTNARLPLVNLHNHNKSDKSNKKMTKISDQNIINNSCPIQGEFVDNKSHNMKVIFVKLDR